MKHFRSLHRRDFTRWAREYGMSLIATLIALHAFLPQARGATVTLVAPGGMKCPLDILTPAFEHKTGNTVKVTIGSGGATHRQVVRGEAFDVPIVQPPYKDVLDSGNVVASSERPLATVAVVVAVRKGDSKPDISTPEAVKRMLLASKALSYPDGAHGLGGAAGVSFDKTQKQLGVYDQVQAKVKRVQGRSPIDLLAKGDIDVAITFASEIKDPAVVVVGPLPKQISAPTGLVGFVSSHTKEAATAKALLNYLSSAEAQNAYQACAMETER